MSTREQFGKYLLLKKLAEDPLGETFRAGMLGAKGMERVALLRVFNGQGLDGQRLWAACHERAPIQKSLRSPNIGDGIEMGEVHGIPYAAYDYVSGKNLATLFDQATKQRSPISTDHALLITERLALALSVAAEHRYGGDRILHGFLVPHLVMISNEGEARLLGFEYATGLRSFVGNPVLRRHFGRYLAPEALAGSEPDRSDDIYSLGVMLYELLTGQPLPPPSGEGYAETIDRSTLATEDTPLPSGPAELLKQSLVPREQRMRDVAQWQKGLAGWMAEGQYNPTTFNLAFYMHNLYRQDIERESQEIEVEKTLPVPVVGATTTPIPVATPAQPAPATAPVAAAAPAVADTPLVVEDVGPEEPKRSKAGLWAALAALLLLGLGAGWWFTMGPGSSAGGETTVASTSAGLPGGPGNGAAGAAGGGAADSGPTPEEIALAEAEAEAAAAAEAQAALQAQIDSLVAEKASAMESQLRSQMDSQLGRLRDQLQEAEAEADERERQIEEQRVAAEARQKAEEEAARIAAEEEAARVAAAEEAARIAAAEEATRAAEADEAARIAAEEAARPKVRRGDLVEPGPNVIPPHLVRFPTPRFPEMARRLNRTDVTVPVRVLVDETGKVIDAEPESSKKFGFGFDAEALNVARGAVYEPATAEGVPVKMWMTLRVRFK